MFGGSLPPPSATSPGVWNSRPLCGSSRGCPSRTKSSMFMHVCRRTELPTSNRMSFLSQMLGRQPGSRTIRYQRWSKIFGDFVPVSCGWSSIADAHRDLNIIVALVAKLPQKRPGFLHPSTCTLRNAASGCSLKRFVCLRASSGKLFVFNEHPWSPPSWAGTVDHWFLGRAQFPSHHFPSAKGFGDVVTVATHRFLLRSACSRRWTLSKSSANALIVHCLALPRLATHLFPFDLIWPFALTFVLRLTWYLFFCEQQLCALHHRKAVMSRARTKYECKYECLVTYDSIDVRVLADGVLVKALFSGGMCCNWWRIVTRPPSWFLPAPAVLLFFSGGMLFQVWFVLGTGNIWKPHSLRVEATTSGVPQRYWRGLERSSPEPPFDSYYIYPHSLWLIKTCSNRPSNLYTYFTLWMPWTDAATYHIAPPAHLFYLRILIS